MADRTDYARLIRNCIQALGLNRDQARDRPSVNAARRDQPTSSRREQQTGDTLTSSMFNRTQTQPDAVIRPQTQGVAPSVTPSQPLREDSQPTPLQPKQQPPTVDLTTSPTTRDIWESDSDDSSRISGMASSLGSSRYIGSEKIPSTFLSATDSDWDRKSIDLFSEGISAAGQDLANRSNQGSKSDSVAQSFLQREADSDATDIEEDSDHVTRPSTSHQTRVSNSSTLDASQFDNQSVRPLKRRKVTPPTYTTKRLNPAKLRRAKTAISDDSSDEDDEPLSVRDMNRLHGAPSGFREITSRKPWSEEEDTKIKAGLRKFPKSTKTRWAKIKVYQFKKSHRTGPNIKDRVRTLKEQGALDLYDV